MGSTREPTPLSASNRQLPACFVSLLLILPVLACDQTRMHIHPSIKLDQVGYPADAPKVALVVNMDGGPGPTFQVKRAGDNVVVFNGTLGSRLADGQSFDVVEAADFSSLRAHGSYYLKASQGPEGTQHH